MSRFTLLLGGDLVRTPLLDRQVAGSRVIAADSGIRHAESLGVTPEMWVGDFDSAPADLPAALAAVPQRKFPADKDMTDGELAVAAALERGATSLVLAGAFGGARADHGFLHMALALKLAEAGTATLLTTARRRACRCCPAAPASTMRRARCFPFWPSRGFPALACKGPNGRFPRSRCRSAPRSRFPTRCAAGWRSRWRAAAPCFSPIRTREPDVCRCLDIVISLDISIEKQSLMLKMIFRDA